MLRSRLRLTGAAVSEDNKVQKQIGLCKPCVPLSTEGICSSLYYILKSLALQRKIRALPAFLQSYRYEKRRYAPPFRIFSIILMVSVFAVLRFFVLLALLRPLTILILLTYTFFSFIGFQLFQENSWRIAFPITFFYLNFSCTRFLRPIKLDTLLMLFFLQEL